MCHENQINDKISKLHDRALRIFYNDTVTSFENLLTKDKFLPVGGRSEFFVRNHHIYNLWSESELFLRNVNTMFKGKNIISYLRLVMWNSMPIKLRKTSSQPANYHYRSCKNFIGNLGFITASCYLVRYVNCCNFL